jgi:hypothetical protein
MNTLYVTSAHFRTRSGCPGIQPLFALIEQARPNTFDSKSFDGPPLRPSAITLRKLARRFKPRK